MLFIERSVKRYEVKDISRAGGVFLRIARALVNREGRFLYVNGRMTNF